MAYRHHLLLLLVAVLSQTDGTLLGRQLIKREAPNPQVVDIPTFSQDINQPKKVSEATSTFKRNLSDQTATKLFENDASQNLQPRLKDKPKASTTPQKRACLVGRKCIKRARLSNKDLLNHLGMVKLKTPAVNHHRKRLASQSRKTHGHKNGGDSKMFVIKLPPNPYYYAHHDLPLMSEGANSLPVQFNTNGKPSRIYHWNIPVLKKMVARKAGSSGKSAVFADSDIFNIDKQATWNDTDDDKSVYRKASFYAPKKQSKHPFRKYFAGNGKPHSFYVIDKSGYKKPVSVHRLLP